MSDRGFVKSCFSSPKVNLTVLSVLLCYAYITFRRRKSTVKTPCEEIPPQPSIISPESPQKSIPAPADNQVMLNYIEVLSLSSLLESSTIYR